MRRTIAAVLLLIGAVGIVGQDGSITIPIPQGQIKGSITLNGGTAGTLSAAPSSGEEGFSVEQLTPEEVKLNEASAKEFTAAQHKRTAIVNQLKAAHGENGQAYWSRWIPCGAARVEVELRGKYALITRTISTEGCPVPAIWLEPDVDSVTKCKVDSKTGRGDCVKVSEGTKGGGE